MNKKIIVITTGTDMEVRNKTHSSIPKAAKNAKFKKGMVLPFQPLSLVFENVNYYIDMPNVNSYSPSHIFSLFLTSNTTLYNEYFIISFDICIFQAAPNISLTLFIFYKLIRN
jgi:hypothetical protein